MRGMGESLLTLGAVVTMMVTSPSATDTKVEVVDVVCEEVCEAKNIVEVEQGEVFKRTHDVKVNDFTYEEARLLLSVAQAEAGNQGTDGMWLVMSVIYNRREKDAWPDSIEGVVTQHTIKNGKKVYQFSTVGEHKIDDIEISAEAHLALARLEMGEVAPQIVAFETLNSHVLDTYFSEAFVYRDHKFYVEKER